MDIAAASTLNAMQGVRGEFAVGMLKKSMDMNKDLTSQLFTKVLEGSLDPNLGKNLDIRI